MRDIGKNIRTLRIRKKLNQDQLAEALHVTRQTVSNYETGRSRPDVEMLAKLAEVLDVDIKELLYGPSRMEHFTRLLLRLAVGAVLTGLAAILYFVGGPWSQRLLEERYVMFPIYMVIFFVKPLFFILLGWTLSQGCLILLRSEPLNYRWAIWTRRLILLGIAVWMIAMAPWFFYLARGMWEELQHLWGNGSFSHTSSFRLNAFVLFAARHPKVLSLGSALCGAALGILGFPGRWTGKGVSETAMAQTEKNESPE